MIPLRDNIPSRTFPFVNYLFIALNTLVFLFELKLSGIPIESGKTALDGLIFNLGIVPERFFGDILSQFYTVFTSMFIHGGWMHFLGNMLFLYIFGDNVEDRFGHIRYFFIYLSCGAAAALLQSVINPASQLPTVGASGAIAGVLGAYIFLYPRARIETLIFIFFFIRIIEIPAFLYLGFWFILQMLSGTLSIAAAASAGHETGGTAFWAHVGGFISGAVFVQLLLRRRRAKRFF